MIYSCCNETRRSAVLNSPGALLATPVAAAPGSGYALGDVLTLSAPGLGTSATVTVTTVDAGGGVTGVSILANGTGYITSPAIATSGGSGAGCVLEIVASPNGIDYLEILEPGAVAPAVPQQPLLLLHCLRVAPSTLGTSNVLIAGGESISGITASAIFAATSAPSTLGVALVTYLAALPEAANILVVQPATTGDLSPYTLRLVQDLAHALQDPFEVTDVLAGFDPQLAEVTFTFRVGCGPEFDCAPEPAACAPGAATPPSINYLAKDYDSFRTAMLDRLNQLLPGRMGSTEPDLGVALAEVIAYVGDLLSYRQDAIATEAYLQTAQSRISLRRHALLVDYAVHDGCNARVWMQLNVAGNTGTPIPLDHTVTRFYTYAPNMPPTLQPGTGNERIAVAAGVQVFEPLADANLFPEHNLLNFHTWGDTGCCLPQGATTATLRGTYPNLQPGDVLLFTEVLGPLTGDQADADLRHRCAVRLTSVATTDFRNNPLIDPLIASDGSLLVDASQTATPVTEIQWSSEDALPFPVCISSSFLDENGDMQSLSDVSVALGNVVLADHGLSFPVIDLGSVPEPAVRRLPLASADRCQTATIPSPAVRYRPTIPDSPLTQAVPLDLGAAKSASAILNVSARDAVPAITLTSTSGSVVTTWTAQLDLLESNESDPAFVVEVESDGTAILRFGDNTNGKSPAIGTAFTASYRVGQGTVGNVGAESLIYKSAHPAIQSCINPMPATGGTDPETASEIRRRAPQAFLTQDRAVTLTDYETITERNSAVDQAVATLRWTGSWYTVFVAAEPVGGGKLTPALTSALEGTLEQYRLVGQDLELESPQYVSLEIDLTITVDPNYFRSHVQQSLLAALGNQLLPNGQKALFYPDNFTFGQTVYLGPVYAAARSVAGVIGVSATTFQPQGVATSQYLAAGSIHLGSLQVARLENDPSHPDHGRLTLTMEGGK